MAVASAAITGSILAIANASFPGTKNMPLIATAVGNAMLSWLPIFFNVLNQGVTVGVAGSGTVNGKMFFVPNGATIGTLQAAGINGINATGIGTSVENGTAAILNSSAQYTGSSIGVGVGADVSKVSFANSATLIGILIGNLQAAGINGTLASQLGTGLGNGLATLVATGYGFGGVVGSPSPIPAAGTSISVVF